MDRPDPFPPHGARGVDADLIARSVHAAGAAILITDSDLDRPGPRILYVNPAHERVFGYAADEVVGRSPRMFQGPLTDRALLDSLRDALKDGESAVCEGYNYRKDGTPFVLKWEVAPVRDADGAIRYWVSTQQDVSERRKLEAEVLTATESERERLALELHDGLGQQLLGGLMMLRAALGQPDAPDAADLLRRTEEVLEGAHVAARRMALGLHPVSDGPAGLAASLTRLACDVTETMAAQCVVEIDDDPPMVDRERSVHLFRIAQEAVANAVRHGHADQIVIALRRDDRAALLSVQDNGSGRPQNPSSREPGLRSIEYRVRRVGGTIDVRDREDGSGTIVEVRVLSSDRVRPPRA